MKRVLLIAALAITAETSWAADQTPDFEYHGYMRSGIGASRGGTDQVCFGAPGASGKFRLGNECDTYVETELVKYHLTGKTTNEPYFRTHFRIAATSNENRDWEPTTPEVESKDSDGNVNLGSEFTLALREVYVDANHVFGEARPWVGKRFYRRQDIHILDYYVIDDSGPGAGVEDIPVGFGKLHLAVNRNIPAGTALKNDDDGPAQVNTDVRLSDISLGGAGKLEVVAIEGMAGNRGYKSGDDKWDAISGTQIALVNTIDVFGGSNRLTIQRGMGIFGGSGSSRSSNLGDFGAWGSQKIAKDDDDTLAARKSSSTTRLVEELTSQWSKSLASSFVLLYQNVNFGGYKDKTGDATPNKIETTAGVRPIYSFTDNTAVALEYGYNNVVNAIQAGTDYKAATLHKITIAPQIAAGPSFWARPQLRLFATYAKWNDDAEGQIGGSVYSGSTSGFSTGAQFEAWW